MGKTVHRHGLMGASLVVSLAATAALLLMPVEEPPARERPIVPTATAPKATVLIESSPESELAAGAAFYERPFETSPRPRFNPSQELAAESASEDDRGDH